MARLSMPHYAEKYPEIVVAYLRAALEADRLFAAEPEKYSELIAKVTGVEAEVNYLFHGPLGLQTRDLTWKPEYRQAVATVDRHAEASEEGGPGISTSTQFVDDTLHQGGVQGRGLDYDARLEELRPAPLKAKDARDRRRRSRTSSAWPRSG